MLLKSLLLTFVLSLGISSAVLAQSLGNAGTIQGSVVDPSGAAVPGAQVSIHNPVTGYSKTVTSGTDGAFKIENIPPNPYHLDVRASGFSTFSQDVTIRGSLPVELKATLAVSGINSSVTVEAEAPTIVQVEVDPSAHVDVDRSELTKIPEFDPRAGITFSTGGVAADANGFSLRSAITRSLWERGLRARSSGRLEACASIESCSAALA